MASDGYNVLLVQDSNGLSKLVKDVLARNNGFQVAHVSDALAAVAYVRGYHESAHRERFPRPDIVLLDLRAANCEHLEFLQWAQRRTFRPVLAVFSSQNETDNRKLAEQLQPDLFEPDVADPQVFERFLHFVGNIAVARRREQA